jgi:hypothetical protein
MNSISLISYSLFRLLKLDYKFKMKLNLLNDMFCFVLFLFKLFSLDSLEI